MGEEHHQIARTEHIRFAPDGDLYLSAGAVDQLKILVPVQRKGRNPLWDAPVVNTVGKRDDSVNFRLMQRSVVHFVPHRRIVLKKNDNIERIIAQIK